MASRLLLTACTAFGASTLARDVRATSQERAAMNGLRRWIVSGISALAFASSAAAQGNLSTQGLGFPPGQLSTKAASMGGSIGESDASSPLNPASIGLLLGTMIAMQ